MSWSGFPDLEELTLPETWCRPPPPVRRGLGSAGGGVGGRGGALIGTWCRPPPPVRRRVVSVDGINQRNTDRRTLAKRLVARLGWF
jgi:hypothetical protein